MRECVCVCVSVSVHVFVIVHLYLSITYLDNNEISICHTIKKQNVQGQDRSIGSRYALLPHITKRRTTNLKTKNNEKCQEIKLYGSLTTKE